MKRLNLYINSIIAFVLLALSTETKACGGDWYWPQYGKNIYRADGNTITGLTASELKDRNLRLWVSQTRCTYSDISQAVYGQVSGDYEEYLKKRCFKEDSIAIDVLMLARKCEKARSQIASPWYYAVSGDEPQTMLLEVAERAEDMARFSTKMRSRYVLQAIRARFALRQYSDGLAIWNNYGSFVKESVLRDLILPYVAGCYYHLHDAEKAMPIFIQYGDMESVKLCAKMLADRDEISPQNFESLGYDDNATWADYHRIDIFNLTAKYCPDTPTLVKEINRLVESMRGENRTSLSFRWQGYEECRENALEAAERSKGENKGLWYYAAAILSDACSQSDVAIKYLQMARRYPLTRRMKDYIHLLESDIYFRYSPVNGAYYSRIEKELRWMDERMVNSFDINTTSQYLSKSGYWGFSGSSPSDEADFWNMALRHVIIDDVCQRLDTQKDYIRMLKLTNFVENRYLHLCDGAFIREKEYWHFNTLTGDYESSDSLVVTKTKFDYPYFLRPDNSYEWNGNYRTSLFTCADSLSAELLDDYISWMDKPHTGFDALLIMGSNTDKDFWMDMLGTHYLRERRYPDAKRVLSRVSRSFVRCTNLYKEECNDHDPFAVDAARTFVLNSESYRRDFAERMCELQQSMQTGDANDRADAMLQYAIGLRNSIDACWSLTSYYKYVYSDAKVPYVWGNESYYDQILKEADSIEKLAYDTFTDRERKARALLKNNHRLEVMRDLRDTESARFLEQHCDLWRDYATSHDELLLHMQKGKK